jgi:hypothetical protein
VMDELMVLPERPMSLYEGLAGAVCFWADLIAPELSHFPGYELPPRMRTSLQRTQSSQVMSNTAVPLVTRSSSDAALGGNGRMGSSAHPAFARQQRAHGGSSGSEAAMVHMQRQGSGSASGGSHAVLRTTSAHRRSQSHGSNGGGNGGGAPTLMRSNSHQQGASHHSGAGAAPALMQGGNGGNSVGGHKASSAMMRIRSNHASAAVGLPGSSHSGHYGGNASGSSREHVGRESEYGAQSVISGGPTDASSASAHLHAHGVAQLSWASGGGRGGDMPVTPRGGRALEMMDGERVHGVGRSRFVQPPMSPRGSIADPPTTPRGTVAEWEPPTTPPARRAAQPRSLVLPALQVGNHVPERPLSLNPQRQPTTEWHARVAPSTPRGIEQGGTTPRSSPHGECLTPRTPRTPRGSAAVERAEWAPGSRTSEQHVPSGRGEWDMPTTPRRGTVDAPFASPRSRMSTAEDRGAVTTPRGTGRRVFNYDVLQQKASVSPNGAGCERPGR